MCTGLSNINKNQQIGRKKKKISGQFALLLFVFFFFLSCSPVTRYRVLSFFFDGVPDPRKKEEQQPTRAVNADSVLAKLRQRVLAKEKWFFHPPYRERQCDACHSVQSSQRLVEDQKSLCFQCHDDFSETYPILHGPIAGGFCTACHNPHRTKFERLLIRKGQEICTYCHEWGDIRENEVHQEIGETVCTECHNPHGGEDRFLLN
jgi:predicted CXXCH cytochrome family protein